MAKLVDARDSKSRGSDIVPVRVRLSAPDLKNMNKMNLNSSCIFCKIISQEYPTEFMWSDDQAIVIKDIAPKAPIHYLIMPKIHIQNLSEVSSVHENLLGHLLLIAHNLSKIDEQHQAFKLIMNNGKAAGQKVFHMHIHFLAGMVFNEYFL